MMRKRLRHHFDDCPKQAKSVFGLMSRDKLVEDVGKKKEEKEKRKQKEDEKKEKEKEDPHSTLYPVDLHRMSFGGFFLRGISAVLPSEYVRCVGKRK